jgi:hypothetical protein
MATETKTKCEVLATPIEPQPRRCIACGQESEGVRRRIPIKGSPALCERCFQAKEKSEGGRI